jgi:hypothetical protein
MPVTPLITFDKFLLLDRPEWDRYELIAIRIPVAASHLHKPLVEALTKIREAERQYMRGDWNGAAASYRGAWRTVLSSAPPGVSLFEHLLALVVGDPRRKEFALLLIKGLRDASSFWARQRWSFPKRFAVFGLYPLRVFYVSESRSSKLSVRRFPPQPPSILSTQ